MIEWRWALQPLTIRDETANNPAEALDFRNPILDAPKFNVPKGPGSTASLDRSAPATAQNIATGKVEV
jgi:hypothetical protein